MKLDRKSTLRAFSALSAALLSAQPALAQTDAQGVQNGIDKMRGTKTVVPKGGTVLVFKVR